MSVEPVSAPGRVAWETNQTRGKPGLQPPHPYVTVL
jgi:hypothetical protein